VAVEARVEGEVAHAEAVDQPLVRGVHTPQSIGSSSASWP
jgi:hypothetical protein